LKRARGARRPIVSLQVLLTPETRSALPGILERWRPLLDEPDFVMAIEPITFGGHVPIATELPGERPPCRWLFEALIVLQDGTVVACGTDWDAHAPLGNARDESLAAIWTSTEMHRRRAAHLAGKFPTPAMRSVHGLALADGHGYRNVLRPEADATRSRWKTARPAAVLAQG
jgi:hypothetical protein